MTISDCYNIDSIICELEIALQIDGADYEERDVDAVLKNVKMRISRQYGIDLAGKKVSDAEAEMSVYRKSTVLFIENIARLHSSLCGIAHAQTRFIVDELTDLSKINYLGFTEQSMRSFLTALQRKTYYSAAESTIDVLKEKLGTISNCREKRLFLLIIVADDIGLPEVAAAIAEILYLGMVR